MSLILSDVLFINIIFFFRFKGLFNFDRCCIFFRKQSVASFLSQMDDYPFSFLFPRHHMLAKPGGSLVFSLSGHTADIISVDMKQDGVTAVTCKQCLTVQTVYNFLYEIL